MLQIDDKDFIPLRFFNAMCMRRHFRPAHEQFRIFLEGGGRRAPLWQWRGPLFKHNKRRRPLKATI